MYVIYKENNLPGVGGVHPKGIEVGLAYYKGWNLANCPDDKIHYYLEFDFIPVPDNIVNGLKILDSQIVETVEEGLDSMIGPMGAPRSSALSIILSDADKISVEAAETFINNIELKLLTRMKVSEIKDVEDDLVDLKKVIHSLITFVVDDWKAKSEIEKSNSKYRQVMDSLTTTVADNISAMSTIGEDLDKILNIIDSEVEIAKIVDSYYLTKKL